jgi:hypothetical protein
MGTGIHARVQGRSRALHNYGKYIAFPAHRGTGLTARRRWSSSQALVSLPQIQTTKGADDGTLSNS